MTDSAHVLVLYQRFIGLVIQPVSGASVCVCHNAVRLCFCHQVPVDEPAQAVGSYNGTWYSLGCGIRTQSTNSEGTAPTTRFGS
ncbi:hypothetical protein K466DRAFT_230580 [Polyporus arcularius HHB13444]|uniref:Secreted protein n=1 Tax=Polyporus arcularius HHB13444 TaxID=1314778 RepID=A0A5C3P6P7_9APHY|nr:hypothetical protein K466DRAFT_230580 [Polyporus arcularius HHB13444]